MKKILSALLVTLLLISGCAKNGTHNSKTEKSAHTATINETAAPKHFVPSAILPDGSLFGVSGGKLTTWNPQTNKSKTFGNALNGLLSPDGKKVAFTDQIGLHVLELASGATSTVIRNTYQVDSYLTPGMWSPDSSKLMYMFIHEWSNDYYIHNTETGEKAAYKFKNIPNFLSGPVDWRDNGLLFVVQANKSKTGEQEYRENGYCADLMLADTEGNFTPVTQLDDGQFIKYGGATSDNKTILVVIWEEESSRHSTGFVSAEDGKIDYLPAGDNTVGGSISPDGKYAVLIETTEGGGYKALVFDMKSRTSVLEEELAGYEPPCDFLWDKDGHTVFFGVSGEEEKGILYTVNIK